MKTYFERAIFLSWYCSKRDCAFCYLSSRQHAAQDPVKDRRSLASIFAEAIICKACGWKIEFLSGGCDSYTDEELLSIIKKVYKITGQKQWLNVGTLSKKQMKLFRPYIQGVCGTVECITPRLRDKLCPSKPLSEIEKMLEIADNLKLRKTITLIIGLGEAVEDFGYLRDFIRKHMLDKITFYRLKPQKNTAFENSEGPKTEHYAEWIRRTRKEFPKIKIVAGSWLSHLDEIHVLLEAGADSITKFPAIRMFNTAYSRRIEEECRLANAPLSGTLSQMPKINVEREVDRLDLSRELSNKVRKRLGKYISRMKSNC